MSDKVITIPSAEVIKMKGAGPEKKGPAKGAASVIEVNMEENVTFFEVDENDNPPELTTMPEEVRADIVRKNDEFIRTVVQPRLLTLGTPCACRQSQFIQKHMRKCQILNVDPQQVPMVLEQDDLDQIKWGLLVTSKDNVYTGVAAIVKECKWCHHLDLWGDSTVITQLLAEFTVDYMTAQANMDTLTVEDAESTDEQPLGVDAVIDGDTPDGYMFENIPSEGDNGSDEGDNA